MAERQGASKSVSFFPCLGRAPFKKRLGTQQLISERANQPGRGSLKNGNQRVTVNQAPLRDARESVFPEQGGKEEAQKAFFKSWSRRVG